MNQGEKTKLRILDAANELFYHQGYSSTAISDIVDKTGLSKGNITYHFKSKDNILAGIIELRLDAIKTLLSGWEAIYADPVDRLVQFCDMLIHESRDLKHYGCPMGTLTSELSKKEPELYELSLPMFEYYKAWLVQQLLLLKQSKKRANEKALELLARVQGIALITHVFKDEDFLKKEIKKLKLSIRSEWAC